MDDYKAITMENLEKARELVRRMEAGDHEAVGELLDGLASLRETSLFQDVGSLTRKLHDALNSFQLDTRIATLAEEEIPDARARLNHVITMTDQAAHRTLSAVEESLPLSEQLKQRAVELGGSWQRLLKREMGPQEFRQLSKETTEFLSWADHSAASIHTHLSDVLMAQGFQDLTGQIIRRVIALVGDVEDNLVDLIRFAGSRKNGAEDHGEGSRLEGPEVPGTASMDAVAGQDEVDDLLSSLGF